MRWLLITGVGNPGDECARIGVEQVIRHVDESPEFIIRCRDSADIVHKPAEFDIAVVCSMPGFWSHGGPEGEEVSHRTHHSWEAYEGWIKRGGKMIVAGFGFCVPLDKLWNPLVMNRDGVTRDFKTVLIDGSSWSYSRSGLAREFFGDSMECLPCPSVFARYSLSANPVRKFKLCNLMPDGSHYINMNYDQAAVWMEKVRLVSDYFMSNDWVFAAHDEYEHGFARGLGWTPDRIMRLKSGEQMLETYSQCSLYCGNRVHGAIVASSFGVRSRCINYDSRLFCAVKAKAHATYPVAISKLDLEKWENDPDPICQPLTEEEVKAAFDRNCHMFGRVMLEPRKT